MRRMMSLFMIAALLSVTSLPLLPEAFLCHAAESITDLGTSHSQKGHVRSDTQAEPVHSMHGSEMEMTRSTAHSDHHDMHNTTMHHDSAEQIKAPHKHQKRLSAAEKECRIECGCGCNRSVDGFPQVLSPHLISAIYVKHKRQTIRVEERSFPALTSLNIKVPLPPPELS